MRIRLLTIISVFLTIAACASKDFQEPGVLSRSGGSTSRTYRNSFTDVWNATLKTLGAKKYAVAVSEKQAGQVETDWIMGKSDRLFSGYGESRIPYTIRFKLIVQIRPKRSGVKVRIDNKEQYLSDTITSGSDFTGSLYHWIPTESSRLKEAAVLDELSMRLARSDKGK